MKKIITIVLVAVLVVSSMSMLSGCALVDYIKDINADAGDYSTIFASLSPLLKENSGWGRFYDMEIAPAFSGAKSAEVSDAAPNAESQPATPDYSDTNVQVEGVQEADIVKTDGQYIYVVSNGRICIVSANNGQTELVSSIQIDYVNENDKLLTDSTESVYVDEIFIVGNRLIVLAAKNNYQSSIGWYRYSSNGTTIAYIYDITDKANPSLIQEYSQSGYYLNSRMIGSTLYLISNYNLYSYYYGDDVQADKPETYVPVFGEGENSAPIAPNQVVIGDVVESASYLVVQSIETDEQTQSVSKLALMDCGSTIYCSSTDLFVTRSVYEHNEDYGEGYTYTKIRRISLEDEQLNCDAEGKVKGNLLNQFSMDQKDGYLRVVTTTSNWSSESTNSLYVLDEQLSTVGSITDLAEGERVYSVRFDGNIGYFVTFRQIDPLFAVDLSLPTNPTVLSELKIPGFSNYLHPYGEGLLFGLGMAATEEGRVQCMKLSMFDVADLSNMSEVGKVELTDLYYSEATYNHKAILISVARNIIGFYSESNYYIYSYDSEEGFVQVAKLDTSLSADDTTFYYWNIRGLFIGNYLYIVSSHGIKSFDMNNNYAPCQSLVMYAPEF